MTLILIIGLAVIILISSIQAYSNGRARKQQNKIISSLRDRLQSSNSLGYDISMERNKLRKELASKKTMIHYRNKVIDKHEITIARLTGDKKILRGRKLKK